MLENRPIDGRISRLSLKTLQIINWKRLMRIIKDWIKHWLGISRRSKQKCKLAARVALIFTRRWQMPVAYTSRKSTTRRRQSKDHMYCYLMSWGKSILSSPFATKSPLCNSSKKSPNCLSTSPYNPATLSYSYTSKSSKIASSKGIIKIGIKIRNRKNKMITQHLN